MFQQSLRKKIKTVEPTNLDRPNRTQNKEYKNRTLNEPEFSALAQNSKRPKSYVGQNSDRTEPQQ